MAIDVNSGREAGALSKAPSRKPGAMRFALRGGLIILKITAAGFLLWWLGIFSDTTVDGLRSACQAPGLLAGALLMALASIHLGWVRWHLLLHAGGVAISMRHSYRVHYASVFFGLFLPGNSGLDLTRLAYAWRGDPGTRSRLAGSVLADRALGFVGLLFACNLAALAVRCAGVSSDGAAWLAGIALAALAAAVAGLLMLPLIMRWIARHSGRWLPERVTLFKSRLAEAFAAYQSKPGTLAVIVALSFAGIMLTVAALWLLLCVLGAEQVSAVAIWFATPYGALANMLPLTPGGLGVGELSFSVLYDMAGGALDGTLVAGAFLAYRILYLLASLPGLFLWLFGRGSLSLSRKNQAVVT